MENADTDLTPYLALAKELIEHIETGDRQEVNRVLEGLAAIRESQLFVELGKLTRELHDAMKGFRLDARLSELTEREFLDTKERLNYVISMTSESAHATLNAVEASIPLAQALGQQASRFQEEWQRFRGRKMSLEEFREFSQHLDGFLGRIGSHTETLQGRLNEVLMAQGYQDLTGQIIRRVIALVQEVEEGLVEMISISGSSGGPTPRESLEASSDRLGGPRVPGLAEEDTVSDQDDVDELLSSMGF